jgi:hypothetical protein
MNRLFSLKLKKVLWDLSKNPKTFRGYERVLLAGISRKNGHFRAMCAQKSA